MKRIILAILIVCLLAVFLFSAWKVLDIWLEYREGEKTYEELDQYISVPETTAPAETIPLDPTETVEQETAPEEITIPAEETIDWPEVDFAALKEINPDVVGWIYIPGTNVNYPVVQGEDNDQYMHRLITGKYNGAGSIFLDAAVAPGFSAQNNTIYGHNMKSGTMFHETIGYKKQDFYDTHPTAMLLTPEVNYIVRFFSGYVTDAWGDAWEYTFTEAEFQTWLEERTQQSWFASDVIPSTQSQILTLSTCSYEVYEGRFVLHGVLEAYPVS